MSTGCGANHAVRGADQGQSLADRVGMESASTVKTAVVHGEFFPQFGTDVRGDSVHLLIAFPQSVEI